MFNIILLKFVVEFNLEVIVKFNFKVFKLKIFYFIAINPKKFSGHILTKNNVVHNINTCRYKDPINSD